MLVPILLRDKLKSLNQQVIIAIDGPAGAGKSTLALRIADRLSFLYIDTGAMYRAVALLAERSGVDLADTQRLQELASAAHIEFSAGSRKVLLNGQDVTEAIRAPEISGAASRVAAIPAVRRALVRHQREIAAEASVVMEGRDIGTVVFPNAQVKIFLDAKPNVRAARRVEDLAARGQRRAIHAVAEEIAERDHRDRTRGESPLLQAPDAIHVDTSGLTLDEAEGALFRIIGERMALHAKQAGKGISR
ncbi:MAG: (d)CMP kinase [Bryobacteraceae bacterium]